MDETWTDLSVSKESKEQRQEQTIQSEEVSVSKYLQQVAGISEDEAESIIQNLGATSMEDLGYVDSKMAEEATSTMKLIPKKKTIKALLEAAKLTTIGNSELIVPVETVEKSKKSHTGAFVEECIAICIDHSGSMGAGFDEQQAWCDDGNLDALRKTLDRRSRMDAVKQVFYAFRDRTETLGAGRHQLGLIKFDGNVETILYPTSSLDQFETIVDDLEKRGATAIYSAIMEGCKMLEPVFQKSPQTDLRILVLSDGQNNTGTTPEIALKEANKIGAIVDAIIVGDTPDENLRKIVTATHGSCFQIRTLSEGFEMMESEAVVSLRARRGGCEKPKYIAQKMEDGAFSGIQAKEIICGSSASKVVCEQPQLTAKKIVDLCSLVTAGEKSPGRFQGNKNKRLMKEMREIVNNSNCLPKGIHIFIDDDNLTLMKALIDGPTGTPFENGVFALNIRIPSDYPFHPPKITFENPIYHCNVSDIGEVCLDVLMTNWVPSLSVLKAIEAIQTMLCNPNSDNALRQWIAEITIAHTQSGGKDTRYIDLAKEATRKDASRSIDDWKKQWGLSA